MFQADQASQPQRTLTWQVPKRIYTLEELRLNQIEPENLLSPTDSTLSSVRTTLQVRPMKELSNYCLLRGNVSGANLEASSKRRLISR